MTWLTWQGGAAAWATAVAAALAFLLAGRSTWRATRPGGRTAPAASLAAVRAALLFRGLALLLLALTPFEPTLRSIDRDPPAGPLRVVVDDSLSMAGVDTGRSRAEWLRVAAALGDPAARRPGAPSPAAIEFIETSLRNLRSAEEALLAARSADQDVGPRRGAVERARAVVLTAVRAMASPTPGAGPADALAALERAVTQSSDAATAERALADLRTALRRDAAAADDRFAATGAAADAVARVRASSRFDLAVAAAARVAGDGPAGTTLTTLDGRPLDPRRSAAPAAGTSPLTQSLRDACRRVAAEGGDGVVLLSDGRSTETRSMLAPAVTATGVPVFTVAVAPDDRSPDVRVVRLDARPVVLAGQPVPVRVRLNQRDVAGLTAKVTLSDGRRDVGRTITLGGDSTIEMIWPDARPPRLRLTARVELVDRESRRHNETVAADAKVVERRERVLVVGGGGTDAETLAATLGGASWISLTRLKADPGLDAAVDAVPDIEAADLIVLCDVPHDGLSDAAWAAVGRAVRDRGASVLVLAGAGDWLADPAVARALQGLLPTAAGPRPAWLTPSPEPQVWPVPAGPSGDFAFLRLDESSEASLRLWLARPRMTRVLSAGPPGAGAVVLMADRQTQSPVLIAAARGRGRAAMLLVSETWRWPATAADDEPQRRFWLGLVQSLFDLPYDHATAGLRLSPDRERVAPGQPVVVRLRVDDAAAGPAVLTVTAAGGRTETLAPRERLPGSGRSVVTFDRPAGDYELALRQGDRVVHATLAVVADPRPEMADVSPDTGNLRRIAEATGGAALSLDELDDLPHRVAEYRAAHPHVSVFELWCSVGWFAAIVACLGLDWAARAAAGLV